MMSNRFVPVMTPVFATAAVPLVLAAGFATPVLAQSSENLRLGVSVTTELQGETDADSGGNFSSSRWVIQPSATYAPTPVHSAGVRVGLGGASYDFDGVGPDRDVDVREFALSAPLRFAVSSNAVAVVVPSVRSNGESGAALEDTLSYSLVSSVGWKLGESLILGPGLVLSRDIRDNEDIIPFAVIQWDIDDAVSLKTGNALPGSRGPGLSISYALSDELSISGIFQVSNFEFRLDDDPAAGDGTVKDSSRQLIASAEWRPAETVSITGYAGIAFDGTLTTRNQSGDILENTDYDSAPVLGLSGNIRF